MDRLKKASKAGNDLALYSAQSHIQDLSTAIDKTIAAGINAFSNEKSWIRNATI